MKSFECRIDSTPRNTAVLKHLNATGQIAFDHYHEAEGSFRLVLTEHEISVLKHHGVNVERLIDLEEASREGRRRRVRKKGGSDDSDDTLSTGFVDQYLDAAEVAARIQTLAAEFPALCQLSALPNLTSGYDGVDPSLTG